MESVFSTVADYLVQQSVQVSVVFALVLAGSWGLRKASAHWRYLLWLVVIAKCLTAPLLSLPLAVFPRGTDLEQPGPSVASATVTTHGTEFESASKLSQPVASPTWEQR